MHTVRDMDRCSIPYMKARTSTHICPLTKKTVWNIAPGNEPIRFFNSEKHVLSNVDNNMPVGLNERFDN